MAFALKEHESDARDRLRAFWGRSSLGRPALHVTVRADSSSNATPEWDHPEICQRDRDLMPEWQAYCARRAMNSVTYLAEAMPGFHVNWGGFLGMLPLLAGGDYEYHESAWIQTIKDVWRRPLPRFDPHAPTMVPLERCYDAVQSVVGSSGFVTPPLNMDGLTTLSLFRTPDLLCIDMVDSPDLVTRWSAALTDIYIAVHEHIYRRLGAGLSLCFFGPMAEGRSEGVQCDFAVNLSPEMFREFVLPDLRRMTDFFDRSLYHLDGTCQMRFLDELCSLPKLSGIQWNPETTATSPLHWLDALRAIRARNLCLYLSSPSVDEAVELTRALGPDGLFLVLPTFASAGEAEAAIRRIGNVA